MREERLKVLKMLEEGKISVDDAMKLLDTLKDVDTEDCCHAFQSSDMEEKLNKFSQSVDSFAKDFSDKMSNVFKDMEPKLRQATKTVVEKTAGVVDDISKSLNESLENMEERVENAQKAAEDIKEDIVENINQTVNEDPASEAEDKSNEN